MFRSTCWNRMIYILNSQNLLVVASESNHWHEFLLGEFEGLPLLRLARSKALMASSAKYQGILTLDIQWRFCHASQLVLWKWRISCRQRKHCTRTLQSSTWQRPGDDYYILLWCVFEDFFDVLSDPVPCFLRFKSIIARYCHGLLA